MEIGKKVKELRRKNKMTQMELAVNAKVSLSLITFLEQGKTKNPGIAQMKKIASVLNVRVGELLGEVLSKKNAPNIKKPIPEFNICIGKMVENIQRNGVSENKEKEIRGAIGILEKSLHFARKIK